MLTMVKFSNLWLESWNIKSPITKKTQSQIPNQLHVKDEKKNQISKGSKAKKTLIKRMKTELKIKTNERTFSFLD
jgi:hypothetical protein